MALSTRQLRREVKRWVRMYPRGGNQHDSGVTARNIG